MRYFDELLPELGEIIAEDFRDTKIDWLTIFTGYSQLFDAIYNALSLPNEAQDKASEVLEEFIKLRQKGEWVIPNEVAPRIMDIVRGYERLRELITQMTQRMLDRFAATYPDLGSFYNIFSGFAYIMNSIAKIFSHQDEEAISKSLDVLEAFLQGEKHWWELTAELKKIISELNEGSKEAKP
jgi:hypothetical protein